jgi:1,2-diacylglycerol 3-beta-galactosyltransferase
MAEYMVAADILVSKAGPGTISEAAALSLPVLLTSFLPGQEEGNVDYAIDGGFGAFCSDSDPGGVAEVVVSWLTDDKKMELLSNAAKKQGAPYAARDIAKAIGESTLKWREINEHNEAAHHITPNR